jgi:hypothetical protein
MIERTTVRLPSALLDRARRKAAAEGRTLTSLIADGLEKVMAAEKRPRRKPAPIPVSTATGGTLPRTGDLDARDADDFDYVERMNRPL